MNIVIALITGFIVGLLAYPIKVKALLNLGKAYGIIIGVLLVRKSIKEKNKQN